MLGFDWIQYGTVFSAALHAFHGLQVQHHTDDVKLKLGLSMRIGEFLSQQ